MKKPKRTAYDYGRDYAEAYEGELGFNEVVDIYQAGLDIPCEDELSMIRDHVTPDVQEYWAGYNSFIEEAKEDKPQ